MPLRFRCPQCKKPVSVDAKYAGLTVECPGCLARVQVPLQSDPELERAASGPPTTPEGLPYKPCPFCTEYVSPHAMQCPHCGSRLDAPVEGSEWAAARAEPRTSGYAVASLVLGLLPMTPVPSVAAIVLGHVAAARIRRSPVLYKGMALARWGAGLGYFFTAGWLVFGILRLAGCL